MGLLYQNDFCNMFEEKCDAIVCTADLNIIRRIFSFDKN